MNHQSSRLLPAYNAIKNLTFAKAKRKYDVEALKPWMTSQVEGIRDLLRARGVEVD